MGSVGSPKGRYLLPFDVEHFRPKKEVKNFDGSVQDGYWWLAFDYSNYRLAGGVPNTKKGGWFPLHENTLRSTLEVRREESETICLLDPISPTDPGLLAFDEEGNAIPLPNKDNWKSETSAWEKRRALESIKRYKLNEHDALPEARRELWQNLTGEIKEFLKARSSYHAINNPAPKITMDERARNIRNMIKANKQLSSVARWCLLFRNDSDLTRLVD